MPPLSPSIRVHIRTALILSMALLGGSWKDCCQLDLDRMWGVVSGHLVPWRAQQFKQPGCREECRLADCDRDE